MLSALWMIIKGVGIISVITVGGYLLVRSCGKREDEVCHDAESNEARRLLSERLGGVYLQIRDKTVLLLKFLLCLKENYYAEGAIEKIMEIIDESGILKNNFALWGYGPDGQKQPVLSEALLDLRREIRRYLDDIVPSVIIQDVKFMIMLNEFASLLKYTEDLIRRINGTQINNLLSEVKETRELAGAIGLVDAAKSLTEYAERIANEFGINEKLLGQLNLNLPDLSEIDEIDYA